MAIYNKVVAKDATFNDPSSAGSPTIVDAAPITIAVGENATFAGSAGVGTDNYAVLESNTFIGAINLTTAREGYLGADILASAGAVGTVTATAAASSDISAYVTTNAGGIGATTATANGYDSSVYVYLEATVAPGAVGSIGTIAAKANGLSGDVYVGATAYSGNIGAITATANADASSYVSAFASAGSTTPGASQGGSIGAITLKSTGDYADTYVGVGASGIFSDGDAATKLGGGNVGAISVTAAGYSASAGVSADAYSGGSIGVITAVATGDSADVSVSAYAQYGNVGTINMTIAGDNASGYVSAYASAGLNSVSGIVGGNIGAINAKVTGDEAYGSVSAYASGISTAGDTFRAGGNIGAISVLVAGQSASADVYAYAYSGGNIGAITGTIAANSDNADLNIYADAYAGSIGAIALNNASYSASAYVSAYASAFVDAAGVAHGGSIGALNLSATFSSGNVTAYATTSGVFSAGSASYVPGAATGIGAVSLTLSGDEAAGDVYLTTNSGGNIGAITVNATGEYYTSAYVTASAHVGSIGNITANAAGDSSNVTIYAYAYADVTAAATPVVVGGGNIGAIALKVTGDYGSGYIGAGSDGVFNAGEDFTAGANIGPISIAVTGYNADGEVSAYAYSGGSIGAITANVKGDVASSYVSAYADSGGSIGAITMNALSYSSYVQVSAYAVGLVDSAGVAHGGSIGAINLTGVASSAAVYADLDTYGVFSAGSAAYVPGTATGIGNINLTLKGDETSGTVYASVYSGGNIGAITVNTTGGYYTSAYVSAYAQYGSIGAITANITGQDANATIVAYASADMTTGVTPALVGGGNIGAITLKVTGADASGYISAYTSGVYTDGGKVISAGNIGNITVTATGSNASGYVDVDTYSGGNIGNIVATATNNSAVVDVYAYAQTGNIGTLSVTSNGAYTSAYVSAYASAGVGTAGALVGGNIGATVMNVTGTFANGYMNIDAYGIYNNTYSYYQGAGNIGNITANLNGHSASAYIDANSYSGGSIGNISLNAKGEDVDGYITAYANMGGDIGTITMSLQPLTTNVNNGVVDVSAYVDGTATDVSKIGATTITVNNVGSYGNYGSADYSAYSGSIGNITANVIGGEGAGVYVSGDAFSNGFGGGGTIGTITINNSSEGGYDYIDLNADISIGAITVNETGIGNSQAEIYLTGTADVGAVTMTFNAAQSGSAGYLDFNMSSTDTDAGLVTIKGGSSTSEFEIGRDGFWTNTAHSIAGVDMHLFNGISYVDLGNVQLGTTIKVGVAGSDIQGTQGADKIFGGAGVDTFRFYSGDSEVGTIGDVNKSITVANSDVVTLSAGDVFNLTGALGTDAGYDSFTTIAAGNDISLTLGSATTVDQYTGLYDSATGKFLSSATLATATASTTDVDAVMYMYSNADDTVGTQMVVVVGVAGQADTAIDNGIITFA